LRRQAGWRRALARLRKCPAESEAGARKRFFEEAGPLTPYLAVDAAGLTFFVATDDRLGRGLFVRRRRTDFRYLNRAVHLLSDHGLLQRSTFIDVGANIGTTTVSAIRRHGFSHVVALEPEPHNFRLLRLNIVVNDIEARVTALQVAVSDRAGEVELVLSAGMSGGHTLAQLVPRAFETVTVPAVTLDDLARRKLVKPETAGLVWIDAPGAEALVLKGASLLLERRVPIVTAVRPTRPNWPQTRQSLTTLLCDYTDFANLRRKKEPPVGLLAPLLDSLTESGDLIAFSR
jgi:FkbM family methyltransferase